MGLSPCEEGIIQFRSMLETPESFRCSHYIINGLGKFWRLANQQETRFISPENSEKNSMENLGSSETLRETTLQKHQFTDYTPRVPAQKKKYNQQFYQWFCGFSEGDGSFITTTNNRAMFIINQKDSTVLRKIRQGLGFGKLSQYGNYYRYIVADKAGVERLIAIFNGNLLLEKTNARFVKWLERRNSWYPPEKKIVHRGVCTAHPLDSSWCSGFIDAEGCFHAQRQADSRYSLGYRIRLRFTLDQRGEKILLLKCQTALQGGSVYLRSSQDMWRLETWSLHSHRVLSRYLAIHPLHSVKRVAQTRFFRLLFHMESRGKVVWEGKHLQMIERLVESINGG